MMMKYSMIVRNIETASACRMCTMSDMKRQECLSSLQSVDSAKLGCVATEAATNGNVSAMTMQPPPKSCRVGIAYWSVSRAGKQAQPNDCQPHNGLTNTIDRTRLDSALSEGEQVNVFAVDEVMKFYSVLLLLQNYYYAAVL